MALVWKEHLNRALKCRKRGHWHGSGLFANLFSASFLVFSQSTDRMSASFVMSLVYGSSVLRLTYALRNGDWNADSRSGRHIEERLRPLGVPL
jgi:hypothetical protein